MLVRFPVMTWDFSPSQLSVLTLLWCSYSCLLWHGISLPVNFQGWLSYGVHTVACYNMGFLSQSQLAVQTYLQCSCSPCMHSHATSMCLLKIPNTGSHSIVWTHEHIVHAGKHGWCCSCGCCSTAMYNEALKIKSLLIPPVKKDDVFTQEATLALGPQDTDERVLFQLDSTQSTGKFLDGLK